MVACIQCGKEYDTEPANNACPHCKRGTHFVPIGAVALSDAGGYEPSVVIPTDPDAISPDVEASE